VKCYEAGGSIPRKYSGEGENVSPPLQWSGVPVATRELLLICEDPDAPRAEPFIHWILYGLPPERTSVPEAVPAAQIVASLDGARQGKNNAAKIGYMGPMPPLGHGIHHYHFQLFALDEPVRLGSEPGRHGLADAMSFQVLSAGELIGTYERK